MRQWTANGDSCLGCPNRHVGCHNDSCAVHARQQEARQLRESEWRARAPFNEFLSGSFRRSTRNGKTLKKKGLAFQTW